LRPAAEQWRIALELSEIRRSDEIEQALGLMQQARPDAVLVLPDTLIRNSS
jgi:hypothetical protein